MQLIILFQIKLLISEKKKKSQKIHKILASPKISQMISQNYKSQLAHNISLVRVVGGTDHDLC